MGQAFLQRLYEQVYDYLGDPHTTRRLTKAKILRDFDTAEKQITNAILRAGGVESTIGRAEATISLADGQAFYRLPPNFRRFIRLEYRDDGDRNRISDYYLSIGEMTRAGRGVVVLSADAGVEIRPVPTLAEALDYTLVYQKGSVKIHHGTAQVTGPAAHANWTNLTCAVGSLTLVDASAGGLFDTWVAGYTFTITSGTNFTAGNYTIASRTDANTIVLKTDPLDGGGAGSSGSGWIGNALKLATTVDTDGGEIVALDDYYNGNFVHIYDGTTGLYQVGEIIDHDATNKILKFRHVWAVKPTGTVKYEIRPTLPEDYDDLYAVIVAMRNCTRREQARRWAGLRKEFKQLWASAMETVVSNVADRPPERIFADMPPGDDPYD